MLSTSPSTSPTSLSAVPSPPRTPLDPKHHPSSATPSDDSSIEDLSFDFDFDPDGNYVRLSKGSSKSNHSSPPTPQDNLPVPTSQPDSLKRSPMSRRTSLSRSESAYPVLVSTTGLSQSDAQLPRSFQRVASGPALSNNKARPFPRRVTIEENGKHRTVPRSTRATDALQHEKENIITSDSEQNHDGLQPNRVLPTRAGYTRPGLPSDPHHRQIMPGPNRAGRVMKPSVSSASATKFANNFDHAIPEFNYTGGGATDDVLTEFETDPGMYFLCSYPLVLTLPTRRRAFPPPTPLVDPISWHQVYFRRSQYREYRSSRSCIDTFAFCQSYGT